MAKNYMNSKDINMKKQFENDTLKVIKKTKLTYGDTYS